MKYAVGSLNAGGEVFNVTIFVSYKDKTYNIQQLKIEKIDYYYKNLEFGTPFAISLIKLV
jgi:hypothetical protein